ncbi:MAG TPA: hypothetical protein PKC43_07255 [Phycisphaerales bacterium]|nr:hypothetical protein [Phycisphaerales bacterium]HMP37232.1 hypothetical protein [Phycisphaerales bacterium]
MTTPLARIGPPRTLALLGVGLAALGTAPAAAAATITASGDNRAGDISAWAGVGDPAQAGYNIDPGMQYGAVNFNQCVSALPASACLNSQSSYLNFNSIGNTTTGFTISSTLTAVGANSQTTYASEQANQGLVISGLAGGETVPFQFVGSIGLASAPNLGTITITLSGPGVNVVRNSAGAWDQILNLTNGTYTLQIQATALGTVPGTGLAYNATFKQATPECGSPLTGSCFTVNGGPFCNAAPCCSAVCAADPFCCNVQWDSICVSGAITACYPNQPLCAGRGRDFTLSQSATVPGFGLVAPTSEITIEFWQRIDGASQNTVVACQSALSNRIVTHTPWTNGNVIFDFGAAFGGGRLELAAPPDLLEGWHHFAFVASGSGGFMKAFHNGELLGQKAGASSFMQVDVPLLIADNFNGAIDELRIWNTARTDAQIAATFDGTVPVNSANLVAYYRMDSLAETTLLVDRSNVAGLQHANLNGSPAWVEVVDELGICYPNVPLCLGLARGFTNAQRAEVPGFGLVAPTQEITIEFWQMLEGTANNRSVVECHQSLTNRIITHTPWTDGNVIFDFGAAFGGGRIAVSAPPNLVGNWHHFAFVASNPGQFMRVYHNGHLIGQSSTANAFNPVNVPLNIADSFNGKVDELRIWNVARTSQQICDTWYRTVPVGSPGLLAYYRFDSMFETGALVDLAALGGFSDATITGSPGFFSDVPCSVFGDLNGDGLVNGADLGLLLGSFGSSSPTADLNCDGIVNGADLGLMLGVWGN